MTTVGPTNVPAYFSTDADFRTWGSTISAALATLGLIQTADTGQINWTTVAKPAATNASQGYEVWRFNDGLQGAAPVFIKIEYGSGGNFATDPGIYITVGSGSNGSGTLTGQTSTRTQIGTSSSGTKSAGITLPFYVSGGSGELFLAFNVDTAAITFGSLVGVERPKDSNDSPTSEGVLVSALSPLSVKAQYVPASGSVPAVVASNWCSVAPGMWSRSAAGASADAAPVFIPIAGVWRFSRILLTGSGDFAAGGTMTTSMLGGTHTYMAMDRACTSPSVNGVSSGVAFRWE